MQSQLTKKRTPAPVHFKSAVIGPPLPAQEILFTFERQSRILFAAANVTKPNAGALLQSISIHDPAGATIFAGALAPLLIAPAIFGSAFVLSMAGPEQVRVPFFIANVLFATWPKDCYAPAGGTARLNNIVTLALTSAVVEIQYVIDDGYRN